MLFSVVVDQVQWICVPVIVFQLPLAVLSMHGAYNCSQFTTDVHVNVLC